MFFTYFKRNLQITLYLNLGIYWFFVFLIITAYLDFVFELTKEIYTRLIFYGIYSFLILPFAFLFSHVIFVTPIYYNQFTKKLLPYKRRPWIKWYLTETEFYSKIRWYKKPKIIPFLFLLGIINAFGPLLLTIYEIYLDGKKQFHRTPPKCKFDFQQLPFSIQYRFYQLQTPANRLNFAKAYPKTWILRDSIIVDSLEIDLKNVYEYLCLNPTKILNLEPDWNIDIYYCLYSQLFYEPHNHLFMRIKNAENLKTEVLQLKKVIPRKYVLLSSLNFNEFPIIVKYCNLSNISRLEIIYSLLNEKDLFLLKSLKHLNFIRLSLKNANGNCPKFLTHLLECIHGIPNIKVYFDCYYDGDFFEVLLVDHIRKHGYGIKSLFFTFKHIFNDEGWYVGTDSNCLTFASETVSDFQNFVKFK